METNEELVTRIQDLIGQVAARLGDEDEAEWKWMSEQVSVEARHVLGRMNVQALHLLDHVPAAEDGDESTNIVGLAHATGIPKGTVSKIVRRLENGGAVARHRVPDNRKEVHLRLTQLGREIQEAHRGLHERMGLGASEFLGRYSAEDLEVIARVLEDLARVPREGLRFRPDLL
ncbi:MarR family transcriptional regulator [Spiractinospora alimapuensis]|uniref:MarR family winged helix-turn-helix transcriptional regulator n=1 Tax=Spiractinospora alimapuensis TaxID=2820884 RepID=UPI001F35CB37|nr:MarR family transcriptional regulator [Spiractinospora alimapuensis]QVQ53746.1 MarR family transcriptional regulator [Spiractinospora alimapuensis]